MAKQKRKKGPARAGGVNTASLQKRPAGKKVVIRRVKDVADADWLDKAANRHDVVTGPKVPSVLPSVTSTLTPQQRAARECGTQLAALLKDEEFGRLRVAVTAFRQAYAVAYREMQEKVAAVPGAHPQLADFFIQYANYEASRPFSEHTLMASITTHVLPWLADVIDRHSEQDEAESREDAQEADEERRRRPVNVGLAHSPSAVRGQVDFDLSRARSLVLAGWKNAVHWLLDRVCDHVLKGGDDLVVHCMTRPPAAKDQHARRIRLAPNLWEGMGNDGTAPARVMGAQQDLLSKQPDLLVFDDLAHAFTKSLVGRPPAASAGDAHRHLRRWCDRAGAALLGAVVTDDRAGLDVAGNEFEQLRTFADLRAVSVLDEAEGLAEGHCRVVVGADAATFDVLRADLDGYGRGAVVVVGGGLEGKA
jgi:hypothetical protein